MYSTCLFCHRNLGSNDAVESFPIGRRLAFDGHRGRLWAVCHRCGRWNLSALEERWEAIEACEKIFRDTRLRVSTENVGLAKAADGTELVRIGRPLRPELAAWRYGASFHRRYRKHLAYTGAAVAVGVPLVGVGAWAALVAIPGLWMVLDVPALLLHNRALQRVVARVEGPGGEPLVIRGTHLPSARLFPARSADDTNGWVLFVRHDGGHTEFGGPEAMRVASTLLARVNRNGAAKDVVQRAVERLETVEDPADLFRRLAANPKSGASSDDPGLVAPGSRSRGFSAPALAKLPVSDRLALEMATHEETERRALEGDLAALEAAWREAEEIAAIADSLDVSPTIESELRRHREDGEP